MRKNYLHHWALHQFLNNFCNNHLYFSSLVFQNQQYYQNIDDYIKESLSPPPIKSLENLPKLEQILKSKNSIFIHIRRGDYTGLSWQLDTSYYKKNAR